MLNCIYTFQIKYTEAILSNSTRKLLWLEITKMLIAVLNNKFVVSFVVFFGTLSFPKLIPEYASGISFLVFCFSAVCLSAISGGYRGNEGYEPPPDYSNFLPMKNTASH